MNELLAEISTCRVCSAYLPFAPKPVIQAGVQARILIIGQAPGAKVQQSGVPWDDKSGDNLRRWLGVDTATFYDPGKIALMPMGFCYPGKGKTGDLPPRPECAPLWHQRIMNQMQRVRLIILIGQYAQQYYLGEANETLTENVRNFSKHMPHYFPLVHPSPRNQIWMARNKWFETEVLPELQRIVQEIVRD